MVVDATATCSRSASCRAWRWCSPRCAAASWCCARPACWRCTCAGHRGERPPACRCGTTASRPTTWARWPAQWFSDFLGRPAAPGALRPRGKRLSDRRWTGEVEAENAFSDGFPLLVMGTASLADLNGGWPARPAPVTMSASGPTWCSTACSPSTRTTSTRSHRHPGGPVTLKLVKPCVRCSIPNVDPASADRHRARRHAGRLPRRPAHERRHHLRHERGAAPGPGGARAVALLSSLHGGPGPAAPVGTCPPRPPR
jgi:hypothetical protein